MRAQEVLSATRLTGTELGTGPTIETTLLDLLHDFSWQCRSERELV